MAIVALVKKLKWKEYNNCQNHRITMHCYRKVFTLRKFEINTALMLLGKKDSRQNSGKIRVYFFAYKTNFSPCLIHPWYWYCEARTDHTSYWDRLKNKTQKKIFAVNGNLWALHSKSILKLRAWRLKN